MFTYSEHVLKICIAQLAKYVGFKSIDKFAFEILIDLLSRFIVDFGKLSVSFANQCNRSQVNLDDLQFVIKSMGLNLTDLTDYLVNVQLPFAGPLLPVYPVQLINKPQLRINYPSKSECETRKEFYQDWQPTLNLASQSTVSLLNKLNPEQQQNIENRLEELDLVDYIEQPHKLKISEDPKLNKRLLNRIKTKVNKLNIAGFTELNAQVPNYIYLSADGKALSFGNKPGRLPEPRHHLNSQKDTSKISTIKHRQLKSKKKSSKSKKKTRKSNLVRSEPINQLIEFDQQSNQLIEFDQQSNQLIKLNPQFNLFKDQAKSCEEIVTEVMNEMITNVEDKFNDKFSNLDESFYDENEAARTLVLLSHDSTNSKSVHSSNHSNHSIQTESPFVYDRNKIDCSLAKQQFNYQDLNNNYSSINDLNNNSINFDFKNSSAIDEDFLPKNGYNFNNLLNGSLNVTADVNKLTINDDKDEEIKFNNMNNLPKLKFKISFDNYKRGDSSLVSNAEIDQQLSDQLSNSIVDLDHSHQLSSSKDKQMKRKSKKINSNHQSSVNNLDASLSSKKNKTRNIPEQKVFYCPTCNKPDDTKTPMIGCDKCDLWYHWNCQNIFVEPNEEQWYCLSCQVEQSLAEKAAKKLNKKKKMLEEIDKQSSTSSIKDGKHGSKKRNKDKLKEEDKKLHKNLSKKKNKSEASEYYCPTCSKIDDGTPMIGCDKCDQWYHWKCVNLKNTPKEETWYCYDCSKKIKKNKLKK